VVDQAQQSGIVITGIGAVSAGGPTVAETCATIRSGIAAIAQSEEFTVADPQGHKLPALCGAAIGITDGQRRFPRHLRMAAPACAEALNAAGLDPKLVARSGFYLCLQERDRPGMDNRPEQILLSKLGGVLGLADLEKRGKVYCAGHAGAFIALEQAVLDLAAGKYASAVIGAVDTYLDEITLEWLLDCKRLKTSTTDRGFLPGEGAAFIVIESARAATTRRKPAVAVLYGPATAVEANSIYDDTPCQGVGLSECIGKTLAQAPELGKKTGLIVCDLNGERYRSLEWGLAAPRALAGIALDPPLVHPTDSIGDTGAASAAINICYAATALARGFAGTADILIWGSSDDGERGSVYMTRAAAAPGSK
jgi:3-oxoacyl-[acyl-carrier-protein] synthase-1